MTVTIRHGDCREILRQLPSDSVNCCVTSPPYFGLRDYGVDGQIGLESSPEAFVAEMVDVFREVRRVLRPDGTLWLNLGDSYAGSGKGGNPEGGAMQSSNKGSQSVGVLYGLSQADADAERARTKEQFAALKSGGLKQKDLIGIPWRVAFALQADGWYLRQDIIWAKPNPMPESVTDRCTKGHEYIFLLSKSRHYYFDAESIKEDAVKTGSPGHLTPGAGSYQNGAKTPGAKPRESKKRGEFNGKTNALPGREAFRAVTETRNKRSVWTVATQPYADAHFATFPPDLIEPCILAGCPKGGTVLDPFGGAGTTGLVSDRFQRDAILIELNPEYAAMAHRRIIGDGGMFAEVGTVSLPSHNQGAPNDR